MRAAFLFLCAVTPALAEPTLTAEGFDALTLGRTMTWAEFGSVYGVEQYLPGRKVRWTVLGDDCKTGHWYPQDDVICFVYDLSPGPYCWRFLKDGDQVLAEYAGDLAAGRISVTLSDTAIPCDPGVGV